MAAHDIMPYKSASGSQFHPSSGTVGGAETFLIGEPISIDANGDVVECADKPTMDGHLSSTGVQVALGTGRCIGVALAGAAVTGIAGASDGLQATAETEGVQVPYCEIHRGDQFIVPAANFTEADDTTLDGTVAVGNRGDLACLVLGSGTWGVGVNSGSENLQFTIAQLLDANGNDADKHGSTITQIIIRCEV